MFAVLTLQIFAASPQGGNEPHAVVVLVALALIKCSASDSASDSDSDFFLLFISVVALLRELTLK